MTTRTDLDVLLSRNRRRMDAERRKCAALVSEAVALRSRGQAFDSLAYSLTMRDVDRIMGEFYGQFPGDQRSIFWRLILDDCRAARGLAFRRAVQDVRRRLPTGVVRAIREAA